MATKSKVDASSVTVKPCLTTLDVALRGTAYRKLIKACKDSGDETFMFLADDGVALWQYTGVLAWATNAPVELPGLLSSAERLFSHFQEWLMMDSTVTDSLLKAVDASEDEEIDPVKAPGALLDTNTKNG